MSNLVQTNNKDNWVAIKGYEDKYEASIFGKVRSLIHVTRHGVHKRKEPIIMRPALDHNGYERICLSKNRKKTNKLISRLILEVFKGQAPTEKHQAEHLDGNKLNNYLSNLKWSTPIENMNRKKIHGTQPIGSKCPSSKLKEKDIREIRSSLLSRKELAKKFGVTTQNIHFIITHQSWRSL